MKLLEANNVSVNIEENTILSDISFTLDEGETWMVFGPNGGGKSSLMYTIMGYPDYEVTTGNLLMAGQDLSKLDIYERSMLGMGFGVQHPPVIQGVTLGDMLRHCLGKSPEYSFRGKERELITNLGMEKLLDRKLNHGFSGGERKRAEVLQVLFQRPRMVMLDEPDSGVDIESLTLIADTIQAYLESSGASAMIITHKGKILDHIKADKACVIMEGRLLCFNEPRTIFGMIQESGYNQCLTCEQYKEVHQ